MVDVMEKPLSQSGQPSWMARPMQTCLEVLEEAVAKYSGEIFLDFEGSKISYGDFDLMSRHLAARLRTLGVEQGQTVACMMDNNLDAVAAWFAVMRLGGIYVPINTAYKGEFLFHLLRDSGARILIAEHDYAERVVALGDEVGALERLLVRGDMTGLDGALALEPLAMAPQGPPLEGPATVRPSDVAALIYTAGTTGPSKGCMITHNQMCELGRTVLAHSARSRDEVAWTCLPLFHMNALCATILQTIMIGGTAAIFPRFSLSRFWDDVERSGARIVNVLGTMIPLIAGAPDSPAMLRCRGQVRVVRGAPFTPETQKIWEDRFGVAIAGADAYGITEATSITTTGHGEKGPPGSSGRTSPLFDVMIVDDEDRPVPAGEAGEIIVRPKVPHVIFAGYWRRPEDTLKVLRNLWLHTGDIGRFDADGWLYFVDRKKDYLRRGGENISTFEMERTLMQHPDIEEVAVHAVASDLSEDDVKVTVVLRADVTLTEPELAQWSIERLPYFAVPRFIEFRSELPKNEVGRILKYQLRDQGCTAATWDARAEGLTFRKR